MIQIVECVKYFWWNTLVKAIDVSQNSKLSIFLEKVFIIQHYNLPYSRWNKCRKSPNSSKCENFIWLGILIFVSKLIKIHRGYPIDFFQNFHNSNSRIFISLEIKNEEIFKTNLPFLSKNFKKNGEFFIQFFWIFEFEIDFLTKIFQKSCWKTFSFTTFPFLLLNQILLSLLSKIRIRK